jgi:hypothetical protein
MRVVRGAILAFFVGAIVVYVAVVTGAFGYMHAARVFDRDGGMSMAIMFALGPLSALLGGTLAAIIAGVRLGRRERARAVGLLPPARPWSLPVQLTLAVLAGVLTYAGVWVVLWVLGPIGFDSYGPALAVSLMPLVLSGLVASFVTWRGLRKRARAKPS